MAEVSQAAKVRGGAPSIQEKLPPPRNQILQMTITHGTSLLPLCAPVPTIGAAHLARAQTHNAISIPLP